MPQKCTVQKRTCTFDFVKIKSIPLVHLNSLLYMYLFSGILLFISLILAYASLLILTAQVQYFVLVLSVCCHLLFTLLTSLKPLNRIWEKIVWKQELDVLYQVCVFGPIELFGSKCPGSSYIMYNVMGHHIHNLNNGNSVIRWSHSWQQCIFASNTFKPGPWGINMVKGENMSFFPQVSLQWSSC